METNSPKYQITVNGSLFDWDLDNATFKFENDEVLESRRVLKAVFTHNTTEEISGEKSAELVLQTAGYRTGRIVSKFYLESNKEKEDFIYHLPNIYLTARWGKTQIASFCAEEKKAIIRVKMAGSIRLMWNKKRSRRHFFAWTLGRCVKWPVWNKYMV
ncbi:MULTISPECIES: hypothetical protein [Cytobacillus]|uniref:hypothetical protein n=1 Tax=Cytobacillus TaxID=2675230 RepID=UPI00204223A6|nr:hypothetical protein [Cytobacillus firmus]MCM3705935.1 hypothetical protein [Cytobacillus firmus]